MNCTTYLNNDIFRYSVYFNPLLALKSTRFNIKASILGDPHPSFKIGTPTRVKNNIPIEYFCSF